jgi:hypothetical protein
MTELNAIALSMDGLGIKVLVVNVLERGGNNDVKGYYFGGRILLSKSIQNSPIYSEVVMPHEYGHLKGEGHTCVEDNFMRGNPAPPASPCTGSAGDFLMVTSGQRNSLIN